MSARPFDLPAAFARMWVDGSIQMMRATTELWTNLLDTTPQRSASSTVSPWWMPPQEPRQTALAAPVWPAAFAPGARAASWPQSVALPAFSAPTANAFFPWLANLQTASASNPFAAWQQAWLQASAPSMNWPWEAAQPPAATDAWHPIATAYRSANGHAMAAVLRTMADVVEPKRSAFTPADFWPTMLGTRH